MQRAAGAGEPVDYFLEPGHIYVPPTPTTISGVLGSAVSVCLFDRKRKTGGMNLFQLPFTQDRQRATACYGNVAVLTLLRMLRGHGSRDKHLEAQIVGGAQAPHTGKSDVGRENCRVARTLLVKAGIPIISEDTGGRRGRKVVFRTDTGELMVIKVTHLRKGDWYPYAAER
ncbi:MAG: chemotaxis protein CheD [Desulfobacterales bacterium]